MLTDQIRLNGPMIACKRGCRDRHLEVKLKRLGGPLVAACSKMLVNGTGFFEAVLHTRMC